MTVSVSDWDKGAVSDPDISTATSWFKYPSEMVTSCVGCAAGITGGGGGGNGAGGLPSSPPVKFG